MRDLTHPNVVQLIGLSYINENFCIVLEWLNGGSLKEHLKSEIFISLNQKCEFLRDISSGMAYLAERKFFHRDLAARNCLLDDDLRVKVADFGLSKEGSKLKVRGHFSRQTSMIYNLPKPLRWMSPESIEHKFFDERTDVWSFGILIWELMSSGKTPYSNIKIHGEHEFLAKIKSGLRPAKVENASPELENVMNSCLQLEKWDRPSFEKLNQIFTKGFGNSEPSKTSADVPETPNEISEDDFQKSGDDQ